MDIQSAEENVLDDFEEEPENLCVYHASQHSTDLTPYKLPNHRGQHVMTEQHSYHLHTQPVISTDPSFGHYIRQSSRGKVPA